MHAHCKLGSRPVGGRMARPCPVLSGGAARRPWTAAASAAPTTQDTAKAPAADVPSVYEGVVFDMDGTLTEAHIDFADMRQRTGIPVGDLFTVMEAWTDGARIKRAMDVILDIEAEAAKAVSTKEGLAELLQLLRQQKIKVGLVTRNTKASVAAFLNLIGPEAASIFQPVLTREFRHVKPDRRLLLHVAQEWGVKPASLLMVGDSFEDVECGNAAGTATCLIAGGGNEKPGSNVRPPPGAIPTFSVQSLHELAQRLRRGHADPQVLLGWPAREEAGETVASGDGAPPPGLVFTDWLEKQGALKSGECSFPRMGKAAGGLATSNKLGDKVLHLCCSSGALTKLLASQGMQVVGIDSDVETATRRGLTAVPFTGPALTAGSLAHAGSHGPYDAVVVFGADMSPHAQQMWWRREALEELRGVLPVKGRLCAQVPIASGEVNPAAILESLTSHGYQLVSWWIDQPAGDTTQQLRVHARRLQ